MGVFSNILFVNCIINLIARHPCVNQYVWAWFEKKTSAIFFIPIANIGIKCFPTFQIRYSNIRNKFIVNHKILRQKFHSIAQKVVTYFLVQYNVYKGHCIFENVDHMTIKRMPKNKLSKVIQANLEVTG